jgi:FkbM family methyltransferase
LKSRRNPLNEVILSLKDKEDSAAAFNEIFVRQPYYELYKNIRPGTVVIDLGAFIGDTAIYFAMHPNVSRVFAYEIIPASYQRARRKILSSPLSRKIEIFNAGVSNTRRYATVPTEGTQGSGLHSRGQKSVKVMDLDSILKGKKNVVIKADIEGEEANLFNGCDLKTVYAIILEYHNTRKKVTMVLEEKGFTVKDLNPNCVQGHLFARKRTFISSR